MEEGIDRENLDSEVYNIGGNIYDSNIVTICISNAVAGIPDDKPKPSQLPKRIIKMKKYEISNPLADEKLEKKRQDAIKSKNNRDKVKHNQKVTENELAKCKDLIKNLEKELLLQKAMHGIEIAELKTVIAECNTKIALRDNTISDLQHKIEFDEFVLNFRQNP